MVMVCRVVLLCESVNVILCGINVIIDMDLRLRWLLLQVPEITCYKAMQQTSFPITEVIAISFMLL